MTHPMGVGFFARHKVTKLALLLLLLMPIPGKALAQDSARPAENTPGGQIQQGSGSKTQETKVREQAAAEPMAVDESTKTVTSSVLTAKLALMADPRLFPFEINVELKGDALVLSGKVPHKFHKAVAGEIAHNVSPSVMNNLKVDKELERDIIRKQDEAITLYVKERFSKSKTLEKSDLTVKTEDGMVALSGRTRYQVILLEAAEAARQVPGVKAVKTEDVKVEGTN